jgi:hypothetical protein
VISFTPIQINCAAHVALSIYGVSKFVHATRHKSKNMTTLK